MNGEAGGTPRDAGRRPSPLVLAALVVSNLVPLVGVGWLGWSLIQVLLLYWIESGIVGLFNVPHILLAQGRPLDPVPGLPAPSLGSRAWVAGFFCVHYGGFWVGHLILILVMFKDQPFAAGPPGAAGHTFGISMGAMLLSHAAAFFLGYVGSGAYRTASAETQMWLPYVRVVTLHLGAFAGGLLLERFGAPVWGLVGLVALKTAGDVGLYLRGFGAGAPVRPTAARGVPTVGGGW